MATGRRGRRWRQALSVYAVLVGLLMLLPTLVVVPVSFSSVRSFTFPPPGWSVQWYDKLFTDPAWTSAVWNSVRIGLIVAVAATTLGTMAALALSNSRGRWVGAMRSLLTSPMIVPGVIVALGMYYVFLRWRLTETYLGMVGAHTVLATPIVMITVSASLATFDRQLVRASESLGAGPLTTFRSVTMPLILPGLLAGALFAFLTSFDETVVTIFLSGPSLRTLPVQMYLAVTSAIEPTIAAASVLLLLLTTTIIAVYAIVMTRRNKVSSHA